MNQIVLKLDLVWGNSIIRNALRTESPDFPRLSPPVLAMFCHNLPFAATKRILDKLILYGLSAS